MRSYEKQEPATDASGGKSGKQSNLDLKEKKKLQNKLSKVESEISRLEHELIHDDAAISEDFEKVQQDENFFALYQEKKDRLAELMESWEELHEQLDNL